MLKQLEELFTNVLNDVKGRWDFYRHAAYLKKMGWTEEAYQKRTDSNINYRATSIKDFYFGYKHIHVFETTRCEPFTKYDTWMDAYKAISDWCNDNCSEQWREDIHRVIKQTPIGLSGPEPSEYFMNEIGGGDALFYAFKSSKDYTMFLLRWS